jgi:hypothetical protein
VGVHYAMRKWETKTVMHGHKSVWRSALGDARWPISPVWFEAFSRKCIPAGDREAMLRLAAILREVPGNAIAISVASWKRWRLEMLSEK